MDPQTRQDIIQVLTEYQDVFAYEATEMPGLDPKIMCHELNIKEGFRPIKQKLRHQGPGRNAVAAAEVKKLLEAGFIQECQYSEWLANVVLVKKPSGAWRIPPVGSQEEWELLVDGSSTKNGCGAGLVIKPPVGDKIEYAVKFEFLGSNNEADYEALILGLQLCLLAGAISIVAKSDSQLIVGQISGEYEAKEDNMRMYLAKARAVIGRLAGFRITHIPRSENQQADALARMASC
ncbi:uncharacterized protein LOC125495631 [Beta vulgaris subsp. vulgaris]|uniref:uncharacterized protein LOC125495631 n=1 Tax=Beta vulgaris subsp. vulgaris TaxID=3555 RepID=UPI002036B837|nr:uncharacterized protein LOC125495631 [Beta vulgaris subsp. vulgaris]